jgi:D-glucosaminate-6-phosphate ammonia-lyase
VNVYRQRGIQPVINAAGTLTRLAGGPIRAEVADAMADATRHSVDMAELQAHASRAIITVTGAEAGYVTSGAAAGLLLATSACLTGLDPARMAKLPDLEGRNEVLVARSQRNSYDHAVRAAGAKLVEIGLPDRASGAGVRDAEPWEFAEAITGRTAAIYYAASRDARPMLEELLPVAHEAGVPVIVDAAAELPPQSNLRHFIELGADLVAFSGGKAIGGPQASGILCGRRDLIMAAALQNLDMDVVWELWQPPRELIDKNRLKGAPRHGVGRSCKVGKEEIIGLLTALDLFVAEGDASRHARWLADCRTLATGLARQNKAAIAIEGGQDTAAIPKVTLDFASNPASALSLIRGLMAATPAIHVDVLHYERGVVVLNPMCLRSGDADRVVTVVVGLLA